MLSAWFILQVRISGGENGFTISLVKFHPYARSLKSTTTRPAVGGPKTSWEDQRAGDLKKRSPTSKFMWFLRFLLSAVGGPKQILRTGSDSTAQVLKSGLLRGIPWKSLTLSSWTKDRCSKGDGVWIELVQCGCDQAVLSWRLEGCTPVECGSPTQLCNM